jgi:hypothetical protein
MIAFNAYANEEGTEFSVMGVHPDADSMLFYVQLLSRHITGSHEEEGPVSAQATLDTPCQGPLFSGSS